jgi:ribosome maturation factor RimP
MRKFIALFFVISFLILNCATYERGKGIKIEPGQKPGAKVIIQKKDRQQVKGELIAVKENSLLLKEHESGADVSVDVSGINKITIVKK